MNNLNNLKKDIRTFLLIIYPCLYASHFIVFNLDAFTIDVYSFTVSDVKFLISCVLLLPVSLFGISLIVDLYRIRKDIKHNEIITENITINKVSRHHTFLMCGAAKTKPDYKTETYIYIFSNTPNGKKVKIRVFPNVFNTKANLYGKKYQIEYYKNSKIATKMTRINNTD